MIKPNRKNKKKYEFHPIVAPKQDNSSGLSEQEQVEENQTILNKLNSTSSKARQQITSILANTTIFPKQMSDKSVLKQLLIRIVDDTISISYNAVFAINNLIRTDNSYLQPLYELNILEAIVSFIKKIQTVENAKTAKRLLEGVYLLVDTILTTLTSQQLKCLESSENMRFIVSFALDALSGHSFLHDSEILFQVIAYISEYSQLRNVIGENDIIQNIMFSTTTPTIKALMCTILTFSKSELSQKTLIQISNFINQTIDDINLQTQYKQNILKQQQNKEEQQINMQQQMDGNDQYEDIDQTKVLEVEQEKNKKNQPISNQAFLQSIEVLEIISNLILSLVEQVEEQDLEDDDSNGEEEIIVNIQNRNNLKQRLKCVNGILRNACLTFKQTEILVEQSWNIIRNTLQAFSSQNLLQLSTFTLQNLIDNKLPFSHELLLSVTENCLQIIYKTWKQHPSFIKHPTNILLPLTNFNVLEKATNKIVVLIFDLISLKYNPEEQPVQENQNLIIGTNLKEFMIKSQNVELQCQCLDTIFSVYSNENFDKIFVSLGYMQLLTQGLQALSAYKHKIKFTKVVQQDLIRFIEYKKEKLTEQKLI